MTHHHPRRLFVPLLAAALTLAAGDAAGPSPVVELTAAELARAGVTVEPVARAALGDAVRVVGRVVRAPGATVDVDSLLHGRVEAIHVGPGTAVRRGEPLVTLHSHELHQLEGELLRTREALRLAETRLAAGEQLLAVEGISRMAVDERRQQLLAARIEHDTVRAELADLGFRDDEIDALLERRERHPTLTMRAPAAGVVLALGVELHGWVQPYDPVVTLGDPDRLELELQLPPDEVAGIATGDEVRFGAVGDAGDGRARVTTPVPQVDPETRTVTLRATIERAPASTLPGVFVEGTLERGSATAVPALPVSAVIAVGGEDHVFVALGDGRFEARAVELGRAAGDRLEVRGGVAVGEPVATGGVFLLKSVLMRGEG